MINVKQKWIFFFVAIALTAYGLIYFFVRSKPSHGVTEIYFADRITAAHRTLIDMYNKKMEGKIKVVPIDFPNFDFSTNERKEILARSLRGTGDGIDILAVDVIWVQRFAKWCEPLDNYFTDAEKKRILKNALESCYYGGELVAVPLDLVQGVMYYREDLLRKLKNGNQIIEKIRNNITWEDFIKLKEEISLPNPFYIYPAADYEGMICCFMDLILGLNPNYFQEKGFNLDTEEAQKALQLLTDLVNKYKLTPQAVTNFTEVTSYQYFVLHDGLFLHGWPSYDKDFKDIPFDINKEKNLRKAPIPHFKNFQPASVFGGWNLMISKFSDKKEAAIDFVKFLLSDESQEIFYRESGYYPIINKIYDDSSYLAKYPQIADIKNMIKTGVHRPAHAEYTRFSKIMSFYFHQVINNQISIKEALSKATNAIQLEKNTLSEF